VELLRFEGYYPIETIDFNRTFATSEIWDLTARVKRQLDFYENPHEAEQIEDTLRLYIYNLG
jgi:hypothetical protein